MALLLLRKEFQHIADHLIIGAQSALDGCIQGYHGIVQAYQDLFASFAGPGLVIGCPTERVCFHGIVIKSDRSSENTFGAGHRFGVSVVGVGVRIEDDTAVEYGKHCCFAGFHLFVPELQLAAPGFLPFFVEIDQDVDPALPVAVMGMDGEVGVNIKIAAAGGLVDTASLQAIVLLKVLDTRELAEEFQEFGGVQLVDRAFDRLRQEVQLVEATFVLVVVFIIDPSIRLVELVEFCDAVFQYFGIQEVLQYDVRIWTRFLIPFA